MEAQATEFMIQFSTQKGTSTLKRLRTYSMNGILKSAALYGKNTHSFTGSGLLREFHLAPRIAPVYLLPTGETASFLRQSLTQQRASPSKIILFRRIESAVWPLLFR